ncbi:integrase core domain-containing protein [Schlesneria paludicola]|uniref:integrase core domain-containing protein n=1 Tax=Schlesneria paludicola TaxID=360056 RepID=UPI0012FC11F9
MIVRRLVSTFHSKVRDEFLSCEVFDALHSAMSLGSSRRRQYDGVRLHSSLGYVIPAEFARTCVPSSTASAAF